MIQVNWYFDDVSVPWRVSNISDGTANETQLQGVTHAWEFIKTRCNGYLEMNTFINFVH